MDVDVLCVTLLWEEAGVPATWGDLGQLLKEVAFTLRVEERGTRSLSKAEGRAFWVRGAMGARVEVESRAEDSVSLGHFGSGMKFSWTARLGKGHRGV